MRFLFKLTGIVLLMQSTMFQAQPLIWNRTSLSDARTSPDSELIQLLRKEADKELLRQLLTVVDKVMVPPSGDKHDYMSMGRYWWPNPDTQDGLPYVRRDGESNPEIEKLDRFPLSQMTRSVKTLALAFHFTNDDRYAVKAVGNLRRWFLDAKTRMNPHLNYGQTVPGHNNGMGRGFGIIDTYSFIEMLEGVELLRASDRYTKKDQQGMLAWFESYLDWMLTSPVGTEEFEAPNNHGTAFDIQVVRYALFVGKNDIARRFVNEFAERRLFSQIEPDGAQPMELARTTAFGYSLFNLGHILDMCSMARGMGIDLYNTTSADGRSITKALEFLLPYAGKPIEDFPYQQIRDWEKVQQELALVLYRADKLNSTSLYTQYYSPYSSQNKKNVHLIIY